jgi:hypothetical protein
MNDAYSYMLRVVSYWNEEYPGKQFGKPEKNSPVGALISNCHYLNWSVPRCCARINEMLFAGPAAKKD